jgi:hypothetical protein
MFLDEDAGDVEDFSVVTKPKPAPAARSLTMSM